MAERLTQAILQRELFYSPSLGVFFRRTKRGGRKIGSVAGHVNAGGYVELNVVGTRILAHRAAWLYMHGGLPEYTIDHINRIRSDNAIANLRDVDQSTNGLNVGLRKHNTSGHRGIYWSKAHSLWTARIFRHGRTYSLGYFKEKHDAVQAITIARARVDACV